jgi:hypothetical protein
VAPDQFKSYDQLKGRLDKVLGRVTGGSTTSTPQAPRVEEVVSTKPVFQKEEVTPEPVLPSTEAPKAEEDESDVMDYFRRLAEE